MMIAPHLSRANVPGISCAPASAADTPQGAAAVTQFCSRPEIQHFCQGTNEEACMINRALDAFDEYAIPEKLPSGGFTASVREGKIADVDYKWWEGIVKDSENLIAVLSRTNDYRMSDEAFLYSLIYLSLSIDEAEAYSRKYWRRNWLY